MVVLVSNYKKSIYQIGLPREEETIIWDFYVTRSFANSASQKRKVEDFGIKKIPLDEMMSIAGIPKGKYIFKPCTTMPKTLGVLGLQTVGKDDKKKDIEVPIEIDEPRLCCLQQFSIDEDLNVKATNSPADALFTHIRNAFAHGNTYFFDNGNVLLEDKDKSKVTGRILIKVSTLIEWVKLIDKDGKVYSSLITDEKTDEDGDGNES